MRGLDIGIPFTRHSELGVRLGRRHVNTLLADGALTQPLRGVYVLGELADDLESRAAAVAQALPPGAALCRGTAAWLFGIGDVRGPGLVPTPADVECVVATAATPVRRSGLRCYQALLGPEDLVLVQGLWCTTPERTAADLARWLPRPMGLAALDAFAHRQLIDLDLVQMQLERAIGHPGVAVARGLLPLVEPDTESFGESWLRLRITDAGFPRPQAQVWVRDLHGHPVYRLDLAFPSLRIGLEYDGFQDHGSSANVSKDDVRRDRLRREFGWQVMGFHRGHVLGQQLHVERAVGELLGQAPSISRRSW